MQFLMCCTGNAGISGLSLLVEQDFSTESITYNNVWWAFTFPGESILFFGGDCFGVFSPQTLPNA